MKKLLILLTLCATLPALATTICADDDVVAIVLDPEVNGTKYTYDSTLFEWGVEFPYGSIYGIATCVDVGGTYTVAVDELRSTDGVVATGGERKGRYCWCQMTHPAVSRWVFRHNAGTSEHCESMCTIWCKDNLWDSISYRAGLFGSILH